MRAHITTADVMAWAGSYDGPKFHALLSDPPYELGFMGRAWDASGVAFRPETWAALTEHLLPGAFGMAFASSRGWHRLACAIEDAGLRIHPTLFGWSFGSGFPKATRIHADGFDGHRYGGQALKPALEPIIVFQKPYKGKPAECIAATGAGALNIDAGRIPYVNRADQAAAAAAAQKICHNTPTPGHPAIELGTFVRKDPEASLATYLETMDAGRWPSNLILLDDEAAARLDAQSGDNCGQQAAITGNEPTANGLSGQIYGSWEAGKRIPTAPRDIGGASRFFYRVQNQLDEADPVLYCGKATRAERDEGLAGEKSQYSHDGRQTPIENPYQRNKSVARNNHPTVKPIDLNRYLASLLLPPTKYAPRRILVPFGGVGSEAIGALMAGFEEAQLIEQSAEFAAIAEARLRHWTAQGELFARGAA